MMTADSSVKDQMNSSELILTHKKQGILSCITAAFCKLEILYVDIMSL